ncbi:MULTISPECIES: SDR family oxidoreductase [unclassified Sphingomonas]|uniref:SDR family oxidoreductase n=1 Tax=unclassified Sphingomonas TaxID=196159 RepID=UPI0006F26D79|nr:MULTISPECIES: SDR family oxidoreductase [unclassified Sphingomonas]KQX25673.1 3-oxoacyl-ACP reductase [Sphingomonas sp. Root1294]KQY66664.1 3-oxoacyl-ACP reductase [Sphingomonas sp. Root50]KRB90013.1 3-oxoacyl-ACP reductase [Sphingomonas sp. Root720]
MTTVSTNAPAAPGQEDFVRLFSTLGKWALVTGGATGIGRMIASALARSGANVIIASRKESACRQAAEEIAAEAPTGALFAIGADVGTKEGVADLCEKVAALTDGLDILVNNSGKTWGAPFESFPYEAWQSVLSVNLTAPFALTQGLLPLLRRNAQPDDPARIINIGSMVGTQPIAEDAYSYAASKAALHHLTRIMAHELAGSSITVNAIAPGVFESRMSAYVTQDEDRLDRVESKIPLGRLGNAADLAGLVHMLCGRGGAYMTGAILNLDGGLGIVPPASIFS